jgi:hypothetical protein
MNKCDCYWLSILRPEFCRSGFDENTGFTITKFFFVFGSSSCIYNDLSEAHEFTKIIVSGLQKSNFEMSFGSIALCSLCEAWSCQPVWVV